MPSIAGSHSSRPAAGVGSQCRCAQVAGSVSVMAAFPVPRYLAETARRDQGVRAWIAGLPEIVADLAGRWSLQVGEPFRPGGQCSWTAAATGPAGVTLVLKVAFRFPGGEERDEAAGLRAWDGKYLVKDVASVDERGVGDEAIRPADGAGRSVTAPPPKNTDRPARLRRSQPIRNRRSASNRRRQSRGELRSIRQRPAPQRWRARNSRRQGRSRSPCPASQPREDHAGHRHHLIIRVMRPCQCGWSRSICRATCQARLYLTCTDLRLGRRGQSAQPR